MTLALTEFGEEMFRRRLVKKKPGISKGEIAAAIAAWYRCRPGAEAGDAPGRPIKLASRR